MRNWILAEQIGYDNLVKWYLLLRKECIVGFDDSSNVCPMYWCSDICFNTVPLSIIMDLIINSNQVDTQRKTQRDQNMERQTPFTQTETDRHTHIQNQTHTYPKTGTQPNRDSETLIQTHTPKGWLYQTVWLRIPCNVPRNGTSVHHEWSLMLDVCLVLPGVYCNGT